MYGKYTLARYDNINAKLLMFQPQKINLLELAKIAKPILGIILLTIKIQSGEEHKDKKEVENFLNELSGMNINNENCQDILEKHAEKIDELLCNPNAQLPTSGDAGVKECLNKMFLEMLFDTASYLSHKLPENEKNSMYNMVLFLRKKLSTPGSQLNDLLESVFRQNCYSIGSANTYFTIIYHSLESFCNDQNTLKVDI